MRFMKKLNGLVVVALAAAALPASAGNVNMSYQGLGLRASGGFRIYYGANNANVAAGQMKFHINSSNVGGVSAPADVRLFCIDVYQYVKSLGQSANYYTANVEDSPDNGTGPMGATKAALVNHLYSNYHNLSQQSGTKASAFQLSLWEIINEDTTFATTGGGSLSLDTRAAGVGFKVTSGDSAARNLANTWLGQIYDAWNGADNNSFDINNLDQDTSLLALLNDRYQDFLIIIPLPEAALLTIVGLVGVLGLRRMRGVWA